MFATIAASGVVLDDVADRFARSDTIRSPRLAEGNRPGAAAGADAVSASTAWTGTGTPPVTSGAGSKAGLFATAAGGVLDGVPGRCPPIRSSGLDVDEASGFGARA